MCYAVKALFTMSQREHDSPRDHLDRITSHLEVLSSMDVNIGDFESLALQDEDYKSIVLPDENDKEAFIKKWKDRFHAVCYLSTLNKQKYGSLIGDLENGYTMGDNKYPDNLTEAYNYAVHYKDYSNDQRVKQKKKEDKKDKEDNDQDSGLNFAQQSGNNKRCYTCGKVGYTKRTCPDCNPNRQGGDNNSEVTSEGISNSNVKKTTAICYNLCLHKLWQ